MDSDIIDVIDVKPWNSDKFQAAPFPSDESRDNTWRLPPSKSHLIRWLLLGSQTTQEVVIRGVDGSGEDVLAMKGCLESLGVKITEGIDFWTVNGVGASGFVLPNSPLNCLNSGTTLRLIAGLCARFDGAVVLDGDASLKKRATDALWPALQNSGVLIDYLGEENELPIRLKGPWNPKSISLDLSNSGQPLSAIRLAMIGSPSPVKIILCGNRVSRKHILLSDRLARKTGSRDQINLSDDDFVLHPWVSEIYEEIIIPGDASMLSFAMLLSAVHGIKIKVGNCPVGGDSLGNEILLDIAEGLQIILSSEINEINETNETNDTGTEAEAKVGAAGAMAEKELVEGGVLWLDSTKDAVGQSIIPMNMSIDLTDANDLISPIAAMLAIGGGGRISGVSHAQWKESNRISKTIELLAAFGIKSIYRDDLLIVEGGQSINQPTELVNTYLDHRLQMTAVILATKVGGKVSGRSLHEVSFPNFLQQLSSFGINFI